jgi:hypothetical protein
MQTLFRNEDESGWPRWLLMLGIVSILILVGGFIFVKTKRHRAAETTAKVEAVKNQQNQISDEFREVAGDAFDKLLALQAAELKGKLFYEPILHEAELAVIKTNRKASNDDEKLLANRIQALQLDIVSYRLDTEWFNLCKETPEVGVPCDSRKVRAAVQSSEEGQKGFIKVITESLKKP